MKRIRLIPAGLIFAFSPLAIALVASIFQGRSMWDESSGTGGYIWFMMLTLPVGFILVFIGLVLQVVRKFRKS